MKSKFSPSVYAALRDYGLSNRVIARELGVNESSVRRGLKSAPPSPKARGKVTVLIYEQA
jgi:hypothetical protein